MNFEIEWTREDLKKVLNNKRKKSNIIFLVLSVILYFYITYYGFIYKEFDNFKLIIGFIIYILIVCLFLYLTNKIYVNARLKRNDKRTSNAYGKYIIKLDDEKILSKFNNQTISYKWKNITKFKVKKNYFFIRTNEDFIGLTFRHDQLGNNYDKLLNYTKNKLSNR